MQPLMQATSDRSIQAIVIGASAGGIDALLGILGGLPASFKPPILVAVHLAEDRESRLTAVFRPRVALPVREAIDKTAIEPGTVHFACAGYHLLVERDHTLSLSCEPPVHYSRPSIDLLMESAADVYGAGLVGILLTGANRDGAYGLARVKQMGGLTVVQDPRQARVAIMPQAAIDYLRPDLILPLNEIHTLLLTLEKH